MSEEENGRIARMGQVAEKSGVSSLSMNHVHEVTLIDNGVTWIAIFHPAVGHIHVASARKGYGGGRIYSSLDGARPETQHIHEFKT